LYAKLTLMGKQNWRYTSVHPIMCVMSLDGDSQRHTNKPTKWRGVPIKHALATVEGQQYLADRIAPMIALHMPAMQQLQEDMQMIADVANKAMEPYRELGRQMGRAMEMYRHQAEQVGRAIRKAQPYLDAVNREIARRNAINVTATVVTANEEMESESKAITVQTSKPDDWLPYQLKGSTELCSSVAIHFGRQIIQFRYQDGWVCRNIQPLQMQIVEFLWRECTGGDTRGYAVKELGIELTDGNNKPRCSSSICGRINEVNELARPFTYLNLIISDNGRRRFNQLLFQIQ